jgi:glycosyltransferase involved in cell wall biosynthesis
MTRSVIEESSEYVYLRNHPLHEEYARLCVRHESAAYPRWAAQWTGSAAQIVRNLAALLSSIGKPKRRVFLLEGPGAIAAVLLRRAKGCRLIMINADPTIYSLREQRGLKKKLTLYLLSKVDSLLSPARLMADQAKVYLPEKHHAIFHLYVDTTRWKPLPPGGRDWLCIGRADRFKNQELIVRALKAVREKHALDIRLHVIGHISPDYEPTLRPLLDDTVRFTGWRAKAWEDLPPAGYYFNLAKLEPSGTNILEALALGLPPIVSTGCGYAEDIVAHVDRRLIVEPVLEQVVAAWEYLHFMPAEERLALREKCLEMARFWNRDRAHAQARAIFAEALAVPPR